jgi:DNA-directed RNA polymerase subunit M/transcription elongation factor TFIIS
MENTNEIHEKRKKVSDIISDTLKKEMYWVDDNEYINKISKNMEKSIYNKSIDDSGYNINNIFDDYFYKKYYLVNSLKLICNIKKKNNPTLIKDIYDKKIKEYEFIYMSEKDINPFKWAELEEKYGVKEGYDNYADIKDNDMFNCGKCKSKKVTYYLKQVRSADEPMTCFFTCHNCGKNWKQN